MADFLLLTRPDCGLCGEFLDELLVEFPQVAAMTAQACVDDRPDWQRRYGLKIPVLLDSDGEPVCVSRFDAEALREALRRPPGR